MARALIPRLAESDVALPSSAGGFRGLAAETLGNAGTDADGFDALMLDAAQTVAAGDAAGVSIDSDVQDAQFVPGQFKAANLDPISTDLGTFLAGGDNAQAVIDGAATTPTAPPPGTTVAPVPAGGGGGAGTSGFFVTVGQSDTFWLNFRTPVVL